VKFDFSGTTKSLKERKIRDGEELPEPRLNCYRCGADLPESELSTIPPNAEPGQPRIYVCENCR
jgi:hypothetical protein